MAIFSRLENIHFSLKMIRQLLSIEIVYKLLGMIFIFSAQ